MDLTKQEMGMCWRGLLAPRGLLLVGLAVQPLRVPHKQRGLQVKRPGSTRDAEWAHISDKNHLTPWGSTTNHRITERFGLDRTFKDQQVQPQSPLPLAESSSTR